MVSAVSTTTFANRKPNLTGSDTHAANLLTSILALSATRGNTSGGSATFLLLTGGTTVLSRNVTVATGEKVLVSFVCVESYQGSGDTWDLKRDAVVLGSSSPSSGNIDLQIFLDDPGVGTFTYAIVANGNTQHQAVAIRAVIVEADLTGSNTQATKNINIISG